MRLRGLEPEIPVHGLKLESQRHPLSLSSTVIKSRSLSKEDMPRGRPDGESSCKLLKVNLKTWRTILTIAGELKSFSQCSQPCHARRVGSTSLLRMIWPHTATLWRNYSFSNARSSCSVHFLSAGLPGNLSQVRRQQLRGFAAMPNRIAQHECAAPLWFQPLCPG